MNKKLQLLMIPILFFLIPLYQALTNLKISLSHPEVQLLIISTVLLSLIFFILAAWGGERIKILLLALITFFFFDIAIEYQYILNFIIQKEYFTFEIIREFIKLFITVILFSSIYIFFWKMRKNIVSILAVLYSVIAITTIVSQPLPKLTNLSKIGTEVENNLQVKSISDNHEDLPITLHIIFDELLSPEAIDLNLNSGRDLYSNMLELTDKFGFRLFGRVYSRHYFSTRSMSNMMNAEYDMQISRSNLEFPQEVKLNKNNSYFNDMASHGYNIVVYQTSHIDFCANQQVLICKEFNSFEPQWDFFIGNSDSKMKNKIGYLLLLIMRGFDGSYVSKYIKEIIEYVTFGGPDLPLNFDVPGFPLWFNAYMDDIKNAQRGTLIFAHFMAPHTPYLLSSECTIVNNVIKYGYYLGKEFYFNRAGVNKAYQKSLDAYYNQSICVMKKVTGLLERVNNQKQFDDATIIIHGDHGSRISIGNQIEDYTPRDFIDNYATFYAIRSPSIQAGYDCRLISLPQLFSNHMLVNEKMVNLDRDPQPIYVASKNNPKKYIAATMPEFECNGDSLFPD